MLEFFLFVFKIAMVAYFLFLCSLFIRKYRDYFMWFRVHKLYKRYKKIGFKNNPWGEFIEYVKQKHRLDKCINAEQITSRKKVIDMLSTYGTIIESYCQQNRFFPKECDEMMAEIKEYEHSQNPTVQDIEVSNLANQNDTVSDVSLKTMLLCDENIKDDVIAEIMLYAKGKCTGNSVAYLIAALRKLGYLESGANKQYDDIQLHNALGAHFEIGTRQGVFRNLNNNVIQYTDAKVVELIGIFEKIQVK